MFNSCSDDNCLWIIILLLIFCGCGDSCGGGCSSNGCGGSCGCSGGNNSFIWIILILLLCCGNSCGNQTLQGSCC